MRGPTAPASVAVLCLALLLAAPAPLAALGTGFTYQGRLQQSGLPASGTCDFRFGLYDEASGDTQIGTTEQHTGVAVEDGLFRIELNETGTFGASPFDGTDRWLAVDVRCPAGTGSFTTLTPRQHLTATPYALWAPEAGGADDLACAACVGSNDLADGAVTSAKIAAGTIQQSNLSFTPGTVTSIAAGSGLTGGTITTSGTIAANVGTTPGTLAAGDHTHASSYWGLSGNAGTNGAANFLGTTDPQPFEVRVNGARALRIEPHATSPQLIGGHSENTATAGAYGATIAGGGATANGNQVTDAYGTVGGGWNNRAGNASGTVDDAREATVAGGIANRAGGRGTTIGGGSANTANGEMATVGGGAFNVASGFGAVVAGGGTWVRGCPPNDFCRAGPNQATGDLSVVSGGLDNRAGLGVGTTVAGGLYNIAEDLGATVSGGAQNEARAEHATIGGGVLNEVEGHRATVGGGGNNQAGGEFATVPGGSLNTADGDYSFAAGRRAKAYNDGCFVLADATDADESCSADNRFVFRVTNAFHIWTAADHTVGTLLPTGGNGWAPISDRSVKENFSPVDGGEILDRLAAVPIETWNLKSQPESIRHIGPMAQDFSAAFGVGEDDTHISTVDADGVALAAIQGLYRLLQQKDEQIAALAARLAALEAKHE